MVLTMTSVRVPTRVPYRMLEYARAFVVAPVRVLGSDKKWHFAEALATAPAKVSGMDQK